jgi:hypothetical protein
LNEIQEVEPTRFLAKMLHDEVERSPLASTLFSVSTSLQVTLRDEQALERAQFLNRSKPPEPNGIQEVGGSIPPGSIKQNEELDEPTAALLLRCTPFDTPFLTRSFDDSKVRAEAALSGHSFSFESTTA